MIHSWHGWPFMALMIHPCSSVTWSPLRVPCPPSTHPCYYLPLAGDAQLKPYVTADPEIRVVDRAEETWFLIIATDGLWDVISNKEAVQV
jgi:hypothetical protein